MAVCRYMVTCPKWPECRHRGFTERDTLLPGSHRASWGSGYRFTSLLRANPGGGSITPKHGSGYPGPSPEGGVYILTSG